MRAAVRADLPRVLELYRSFNSYDPAFDEAAAGPAWDRLVQSGLVTVIVAELGGEAAATCTLAVVPNLTSQGRPYAVIENVVTHPDHRRAGLGRQVLAFAVAAAWAPGCYKVTLSTGSTQESTLRFYEAAGFRRNAKTFLEMRRAVQPTE